MKSIKKRNRMLLGFALTLCMSFGLLGLSGITSYADTMVYITKTGTKYHAGKCGSGTFTLTTLSDAKSRGLTPCQKCFPNGEPKPTPSPAPAPTPVVPDPVPVVKTNISSLNITFPASREYSGSKLTPAITVTDGAKILTRGTDYTVSYSNNVNVGKATVKITGIGNYTGTVNKSFKIIPKGTTLKGVSTGTKAFTVTWAPQRAKMKASFVTGYQIQYSTSKTFAKGNKIVSAKKYTTGSKTVKNLVSKKIYYVRVRTYKTVGGVDYYSTWSPAKAVKVR